MMFALFSAPSNCWVPSHYRKFLEKRHVDRMIWKCIGHIGRWGRQPESCGVIFSDTSNDRRYLGLSQNLQNPEANFRRMTMGKIVPKKTNHEHWKIIFHHQKKAMPFFGAPIPITTLWSGLRNLCKCRRAMSSCRVYLAPGVPAD